MISIVRDVRQTEHYVAISNNLGNINDDMAILFEVLNCVLMRRMLAITSRRVPHMDHIAAPGPAYLPAEPPPENEHG